MSASPDGATMVARHTRPRDLQRLARSANRTRDTAKILHAQYMAARVNGCLRLLMHNVKARSLEPKRLRISHA
eukprot:CAMPEP_0183524948 /NCGR_PEP_ID=MMETSP0371-20130417/20278_1 /TAXON_ID=268820 /ORGANISM="Peridinium aciculiferum, Strain PAER-2" /LENGTH=72 /DNA_ID=CAMNT_0025724123 /DNA_START=161 /DNA_END=379 /DNA_ORIENTATION=-